MKEAALLTFTCSGLRTFVNFRQLSQSLQVSFSAFLLQILPIQYRYIAYIGSHVCQIFLNYLRITFFTFLFCETFFLLELDRSCWVIDPDPPTSAHLYRSYITHL